MARTFELPDPGEGIHEAEVVELHVSTGDRVSESDVLLEVETDKALVEIPSPFTGLVREILVEVGDDVRVGDALLEYEQEGDEPGAGDEGEEGSTEARGEDGEEEAATRETAERSKKTDTGDEPEAEVERKAKPAEEPKRETADAARDEGKTRRAERPVPAAPATRRLARELGVDLGRVEATGPEGRVTAEDVRAAADREEAAGREGAEDEMEGVAERERADEARRGAAEEGTEELEAAAGDYGDPEEWGPVEREPLRSVRRTTARRMADAWRRIPHVTHVDHADITELESFRAEHDQALEGGELTLTVFLLEALVAALKEFPRFNARLDEESGELVLLDYYHLGVAVDTERGLIVPVIRDVDAKSLSELAVELDELVGATRSGSISRDQMRGGTFTLTNPGPLGGDLFTPIINPPQVAILGAGQASRRPWVVASDDDERIEARLILPLCVAFDHRVNDGADAARFTSRVVEILEDPSALVRNL